MEELKARQTVKRRKIILSRGSSQSSDDTVEGGLCFDNLELPTLQSQLRASQSTGDLDQHHRGAGYPGYPYSNSSHEGSAYNEHEHEHEHDHDIVTAGDECQCNGVLSSNREVFFIGLHSEEHVVRQCKLHPRSAGSSTSNSSSEFFASRSGSRNSHNSSKTTEDGLRAGAGAGAGEHRGVIILDDTHNALAGDLFYSTYKHYNNASPSPSRKYHT